MAFRYLQHCFKTMKKLQQSLEGPSVDQGLCWPFSTTVEGFGAEVVSMAVLVTGLQYLDIRKSLCEGCLVLSCFGDTNSKVLFNAAKSASFRATFELE